MHTIVWTGSRGWKDVGMVADAIDSMRRPFRSIVGGAPGFDTIVEQKLIERGLPYLRFDANWDLYGNGAGHRRNDLMLAWLLRLDANGTVVSGWDGKSPGTRGCIERALAFGIKHMPLAHYPSTN